MRGEVGGEVHASGEVSSVCRVENKQSITYSRWSSFSSSCIASTPPQASHPTRWHGAHRFVQRRQRAGHHIGRGGVRLPGHLARAGGGKWVGFK